jgi:hypothetical protein
MGNVRVQWKSAGFSLVADIVAMIAFFGMRHPPSIAPTAPMSLVSAPEKSIAVLPFENVSANKDDAYFADGVQDEILNNLARIAQLKVISRTLAGSFRLLSMITCL